MTTLLILFASITSLLLFGFVYQSLGKRLDQKRMPPPGRLVTVNGRSIHLLEKGTGRPVILEAGIAGTSLGWTLLHDRLSSEARVISYDRAGLGWSDAVRTPRTLSNAVNELRELLKVTGISPPYILVGHSYGGLIVHHYASLHPDEVSGLVLVDPVDRRDWLPLTERQRRRLHRGVSLSRRGAWLARFGVVRFALWLLVSGGTRLPRLIARMSAGKGASVTERLTGEVRKLPPETWPMVRMHWSDEKCFRTMAKYLELLPANVSAAEQTNPPADIPVILLTAPGAEPELSAAIVHRPATRGGHWIQLDEPELIMEAVIELLSRSNRAS